MNWLNYINRGVAALLFFYLSVAFALTNGKTFSCKPRTENDILLAIAVVGMLIAVGWAAGYEHRRNVK